MLKTIQLSNLAWRFILELGSLAALAYSGWQAGGDTTVKLGLAIGLPLLAAVIWGVFGAPTSSRRLQGPSYLTLEVVVWGGSALALAAAGQPVLGLVLALMLVVNRVLIYACAQ